MLSLFIKTERVCSMKRGRIKKIILMTLGVVFYAAAIGLFLDPNTLAPGGISGISVILSRLIPIGTGTLILLFNVPILIAGAWKFGFRFICSTIYCTVLSSLMINIFSSAGEVDSLNNTLGVRPLVTLSSSLSLDRSISVMDGSSSNPWIFSK